MNVCGHLNLEANGPLEFQLSLTSRSLRGKCRRSVMEARGIMQSRRRMYDSRLVRVIHWRWSLRLKNHDGLTSGLDIQYAIDWGTHPLGTLFTRLVADVFQGYSLMRSSSRKSTATAAQPHHVLQSWQERQDEHCAIFLVPRVCREAYFLTASQYISTLQLPIITMYS